MTSSSTSALVAALLLVAAPAAAHDTATSTFEGRPAVSAAGAGLQVVFALDATSLLDLTGATTGDPVLAYLDARFEVRAGGALCAREAPRRLAHDPGDKAVIVDVVYRCAGRLELESSLFLDELIPHSVIGTVHHGGRADRFFFSRGERIMTVEVAPPSRAGFRTATPPPGAFAAAAAAPAPARRDGPSPLAILVSVSGLLGAAWCIRRLATV